MNIQITNSMLMALIINLVYAKAIGLTQGIMARESGSDIWIETIFATLQGVLVMFITVWAVRRTPHINLLQQAELILGNWLGKVVSVLVFFFFLGAYSTIMITFVFHLMDYFLPEFPVYIFVLAAVLVPLYAVFSGLEVTSRIAIVGVFSIIALNLLLLAGSFKDMNIHRLMPVFESGFMNTVWTSRNNDTDWAMATMMTGLILPFVKDEHTWANSGPGGILYGGILVLMWPILECGVLSAPETAHYIVACMQMARSAQIGTFIHRYEMIMVAFFGISLMVQLMVTSFCASLAMAHTLGLADYRRAILPVTMVLGGVSYYVVTDHQRAMLLLESYWPQIALPIAFLLPLLLWLLGFVLKARLMPAKG